MRKKILEILLGSLKAKIVTSIVAVSLVGGAVTAGIIHKNSIDRSTKKEVSFESKSEDLSKESEDKVDEKEVETLDNNEQAVDTKTSTNESEDQNATSSNEGGNNGGSAESSKDSSSNKGGNTNTSNNTNSNNGSTVAPSSGGNSNSGNTSTPPKQTNPEPPKQEPVRASGIDEELTKKLNSEDIIPYYEAMKSDPRTDIMIQAARTMAFGGAVPDSIKQSWKPYSNRETIFSYKNHAVNVVVGETEYYYTRMPSVPGMNAGFSYVIAYWDAGIKNYKLYYIKISMA